MPETPQPLPLPPDYDPQAYLQFQTTENGVFHESRKGASFAQRLVANGTLQDLALAEKVLNVVLGCQELHPKDPHYGNFYWMLEDSVVFDLNAVEFNLEHLIPMMIEHGERLSPEMQRRVLEAIRLGLVEIERLDVRVVYSNITLLDVLNTCLGGELLRNERLAHRGYEKLAAWMRLTDDNGTPYEFNSPTYTWVDLRALQELARLVHDPDTRIRARTAVARLGLSVALHIHRATGRWAGPHGRAYQPSIHCDTPPEIQQLREWVASGELPGWVLDALDHRPQKLQVDETAFAPFQVTTTTYQSPSFALGTASKEHSGQSNVLMAHYTRPGASPTPLDAPRVSDAQYHPGEGTGNAEKPGVIYTRYLLNDKWLGDFYHATDRTRSRNLIDEGRFWGVQQGSRAIGLYCLPNNPGVIRSAKAALIWTRREGVEEIWVDERRVAELPAEIKPGEVVVVGSGGAYAAVRVLTCTDIGRDAPLRLREIHGDLVLEIYNYQGQEKSFWEMNWPGAFYQGKPQCGFYFEMAERDAYPDGRAFGRVVAEGDLRDQALPPFVYDGTRPRPWTVSYTRGGQEMGIEVDLMEWKLRRRWTENGELGFPMLESPLARQSRSGEIRLGESVLRWEGAGNGERAPAWLFACPESGRWAAGYTGSQPVALSLTLPGGRVDVPAMAVGTLVWDQGQVRVDAVSLQGQPRISI
jgi:hypothetical protein